MTKDKDDLEDIFMQEILRAFKQAGLGTPKISGFTMTFDSENGWHMSKIGQPTVDIPPSCECQKAPKVEIIETEHKYNLTMDVGSLTENDIKIYPLPKSVIIETTLWKKEVPLAQNISQEKVESTLANGVLDIGLLKVKGATK